MLTLVTSQELVGAPRPRTWDPLTKSQKGGERREPPGVQANALQDVPIGSRRPADGAASDEGGSIQEPFIGITRRGILQQDVGVAVAVEVAAAFGLPCRARRPAGGAASDEAGAIQ